MPTAPARASAPTPTPFARVADVLRGDRTAGVLLLAATALALVLANSPAAPWYEAVREFRFGPEALHLDLSVQSWAADGLLAIFFFVVGLELKEEFVTGRLRDPRAALVPIVAAIGGVAVPAAIYAVVNADGGAPEGWAIPAATDIAFALAVFAVVGRFLPPALRTFLLTLAIVDDLIAITIIAVVFSAGLDLLALGLALVPLALFGVALQRGVRAWWVLLPLAFAAWTLVHASGVHATIAGVALGLLVPVRPSPRAGIDTGHGRSGLAHHFAHRWQPLSAGIAVPVFAFFAAGVEIGGLAGLVDALTSPVALGVMLGLVVGKPLGIVGAAWLVTRIRGVRLDGGLNWGDLAGLGLLAGIGFTVSLLVGELALGGTVDDAAARIGILAGSLVAAVLGGVVLAARGRRHARLAG